MSDTTDQRVRAIVREELERYFSEHPIPAPATVEVKPEAILAVIRTNKGGILTELQQLLKLDGDPK